MTKSPASTAPRRGLLLIVSSPSGAGKTTLTRLLLAEDKQIELSISVTTRPRRMSELDKVHYYFLTAEQFEEKREQNQLLEWAKVHGNYYGSPREPVDKALSEGRDVLFDIDWQGTMQIYEKMREDIVSVFILPPSADELRARLERRAEDKADVIARRLQNALIEIGHWSKYDYVLVNEDLQKTYGELKDILASERAKRARKAQLGGLIETLKADLRRMSRET